jgi:hypothetical protein
MRFITGPIGVIAAALFVVYSAVVTWHVAYAMTTEFKELAGWAAAGIVLWECLGLLYVRQCWANGSKWLAVGGLALVLSAAVYTARLDLRFHVAGQADMAASREASVETRKMTREELAKARAQRDIIQARKKLTGFEREELENLTTRIATLEGKFDTQIVNAGGMPEAGWASRMLGSISDDEVWWQDALMVFGLLFWALARMLAMPLAVASMASIRKPVEAATAAKPAEDAIVQVWHVPAPPAPAKSDPATPEVRTTEHSEKFAETNTPWASEAELQKLRDLVADMKAHGIAPPVRGEEPSPIGGGSGSRAPEPTTEVATEEAPATEEMAPDPKIVRPAQWHEDNAPPAAPRTNGRRGKKDPTKHLTRKDQIVIQWLADSCSITGDEADVATGGACHTSYRQYCDGRRVPQKDRVAQARMSAILSGQLGTRVNGRGKRNGKEAEFPGLLINPIVAQTQRARRYG